MNNNNSCNKEKLLSVIIVSFNCLNLLKQCIESIYKYNDIGDKLELLIVDNGNDSETKDYLNINYPEIKYIKNENRGFGQANNIGADNANGQYLFFLNPDTILTESIFNYGIDVFKNNDKIGLLGFKLIGTDGSSKFSFGFRKPITGFAQAILFKIINKIELFIPSVMYTSGADMLIPKKLFNKIGKFDDKIFLYNEEADLCNRVNQYNKDIKYCKNKKIIHLEGGTESFNNKSYIRFLDSYQYYCKKYNIDFQKYLSIEYKRFRLLSWLFFKLKLRKYLYFKNRADALLKKIKE